MTRLKFCLNASTIMTTPIMRQIEVAAAAGYEAIELWHDHIDTFTSEGGRVSEIRTAVDDHGLVVPTTIYLAGWFDSQGDEYLANLDECKRRMTDSAMIGAPHIIAGPPGGSGPVPGMVNSFIHSPIHSFMHSFIHSFINSCILPSVRL
mgnify:CR=1 FL=1